MKLYATVTSERATKGQGGNKHLTSEISINDEDIKHIVKVLITRDEEKDRYIVTIFQDNEMISDKYIYRPKGNKQKTAKECKHNNHYADRNGFECRDCGYVSVRK